MASQYIRAIPAKIIFACFTINFMCQVKFVSLKSVYGVLQLEDNSRTINHLNTELEFLYRVTANLEWKALVNSSINNFRLIEKFTELKTMWRNKWCEKLQASYYHVSMREKRMVTLLCRGPKYTPILARKTAIVVNKLSAAYASSTICRRDNHELKCYTGEPDLVNLMAITRNESLLRWAWTAWRDKMSKVKYLYAKLIKLQNIAARNNGYNDIGDCWREEFEIPQLENFLETTYRRVEQLYKRLHAVVRFRLAEVYPEVVNITKPIPAHLLGNLWSQNWATLIDIVLPKYAKMVPSLTEVMERKNYTVLTMIKKAEEFYESLGFPKLTKEFWKYSIFEKTDKNKGNCHATAANMYIKDDFRMFACLKTTVEDLHVVQHEIGHIQYYMAYQNQSTIHKDGVNTAFHEAIGDAIMYGVITLQHLQRMGLINESSLNPKNSTNPFVEGMLDESVSVFELVTLVRQALIKLPQLASGIAMEKWRWEVFRGRIAPEKFNRLWWQLHRRYMGIAPISLRSDDRFDPAAKFHIVNNIPYTRYFLANILQVQLFQGMCEAAITGKVGDVRFNLPLYKCDIYGSKSAADRLRSLMKRGNNVSWREALRITTGFSDYLVEPLLRYYEPVRKWLDLEIERYDIPVDWH